MQNLLKMEIAAFLGRKAEERRRAALRAATWKALGLDPAQMQEASPEQRAARRARLARKIRRERILGLCRPSEYDLAHHIEMKRALKALEEEENGPRAPG